MKREALYLLNPRKPKRRIFCGTREEWNLVTAQIRWQGDSAGSFSLLSHLRLKELEISRRKLFEILWMMATASLWPLCSWDEER
jgi:hypothetical protein